MSRPQPRSFSSDMHAAARRRAQRRRQESRRRRLVYKPFKGYHPHAKQRALHESLARFLVVVAGRRSGKTFALIRVFLARILEDLERAKLEVRSGLRGRWRRPRRLGRQTKPFLHYWIVAPTYDLAGTCLMELFELLGGENSPMVLKWDASLNQLWLAGGILVELKSAQIPERLVAAGLDGLLVDEAARLKPDVWRDNLKPTLDDKGGWGLFGTTPLGQNWLYHDLWQLTQHTKSPTRRNEDYEGHHFTTMDNTAVPRLVEEALRAKKDLPEANWRRNYAADFNAFEGKIYGMFLDDGIHVYSEGPTRFRELVAGVDWGYTNPGSVIVLGVTHDDELYVVHEEYETEVLVSPPPQAPDGDCWSNRIVALAKQGVTVFYADPSSPSNIATCRRALAAAGVGAIILPANNAVQAGIEAVSTMLKPVYSEQYDRVIPAMYIHRGCVHLRSELSTYRYQGNTERPIKENDHACDALRYAVLSHHLKGRAQGLSRLAQFDLFDHVA